ncbi:heparan sulfate 2-O-sulfotransferase 1-like [Hydractinia symbiolongicarpus]|uniref:heparan sulfate 2-O-sulfotransferase 1-like n=1 Tax=Hydractinia symbiolongicarpus TaxID=13093 RepID=UPI00254BC7B9|nr:heparan sulfate 2-O-sulfotransferase 1-like [Hydractinia symbiolongicarpus]
MKRKKVILFCILSFTTLAVIIIYHSCNMSTCSAMYETLWRPKAMFENINTAKIKKYFNPLWARTDQENKKIKNSQDINERHKLHRVTKLNTGMNVKINLNQLRKTIEARNLNLTGKDKKLDRQGNEISAEIQSNMTHTKHNLIRHKGIMTFDKISCNPIFPKVLLYNRIFKTGSTSLGQVMVNASEYLSYHVQKSTTEDWYNTGDSYPYPDVIENHVIKNVSVAFVSHFYFRNDLKIERPYTYINMLRDPVRRIISHYKYMRLKNIRPPDRIKELKKSGLWNESLLTCVRKQHRGCEDNVMTRFFCGPHNFCKSGSKKALEKAKFNMQRYYSAVGILEKIELFLKVLQTKLPTFFNHTQLVLPREKKNTNEDYYKDIDKKTLKKIRARNKADKKLYKFASERFKREISACRL